MAHVDANEVLLREIARHLSPQQSVEDERPWLTSALQTVSSRSPARTNQFEVFGKVNGLVEKLRVLNRDGRADSLEKCATELEEKDSRWTPEILALLLNLANQPSRQPISLEATFTGADASKVSSTKVDTDIESSDEEGAAYEDTILWRDVDFAADESDGDESVSIFSEASSKGDQPESPPTEDLEQLVQSVLVSGPSSDAFPTLTEAYWQRTSHTTEGDGETLLDLTELEVIRECIHMLLGLPTTVFRRQPGSPFKPCRVRLKYDTQTNVMALLNQFASIGEQIQTIRSFINTIEPSPIVQRFQSSLSRSLMSVDAAFNTIQQSILDEEVTFVTSLMALSAEVDAATTTVSQSCPLLSKLDEVEPSRRPFCILEALFELTCAGQISGDPEGYEYWAKMFFECFELYQKPLSLWMEKGELRENDQVLFISKNKASVSPDSLWRDQFLLVKDAQESLYAPNFLRLAASKIFIAGKNVFFLKLLNIEVGATNLGPSLLCLGDVCRESGASMLSPFPELFNASAVRWVNSKHQASVELLRQQLDGRGDFRNSLDAIEYLFLAKDGALTDSVLRPVFERLDDQKKHWNDVFVLAELFEQHFARSQSVDIGCIAVITEKSSVDSKTRGIPMKCLEEIKISYRLPWLVANIVKPASMETYQRIFVWIAQMKRAVFLLQRVTARRSTSLGGRLANTIYRLRARLLHFVEALLSHVLLGVVEARTSAMRRQMAEALDIDGMEEVHTQYMSLMESECLLSKKHTSVKQAITSVLDLTILFRENTSRHVVESHAKDMINISKKKEISELSSDEESDEETSASRLDSRQNAPIRTDELVAKLRKIEATYTQLLGFIAATVRSLSKSDGALCWEVLACQLAADEPP